MTVASSQPTMRQRVSEFFHPENRSTHYAVMQRNFDGRDIPKKNQDLIGQLDDLDGEPRLIKNFLTTAKGKEDKKAIRLLDSMIRSGDEAIASRAKSIFVQYLDISITKQNLIGSSINPTDDDGKTNAAEKAEAAFEDVCKFLGTNNQGERQRLAKEIANDCGYLYRADGDDRNNTSWKRGMINPEGKADRDQRLFNFFHKMKDSESGKVLHGLIKDFGIQDMHSELYSNDLAGTETGLNGQVKQSIKQKNITTARATNPLAIWGNKSFTQIVKPNNDEEREFLNTYKKSADFQFSVSGLENKFIEANNPDERKALILDFMAAFELLSFRKANLIKAGRPSDDPILKRAAKKVEAEQKKLLEALKEHTGRDPELAEAVQSLFSKEGSAIFMYHMAGTLGAAEKSVSNLVAREAKELKKDYGADSIRLNSGDNLEDSYKDLEKLRKESEDRVGEQAIELANQALTVIGRPETIDYKLIESFERWTSNISMSPDITDETKAGTDDAARWDKIKKNHENAGHQYFGLNAACDDFEAQLMSSTEPAVEYVRDNFERIYGISIKEMLAAVKDREIIVPSSTEEAFLINNSERLGSQIQTVAEQKRAKNHHRPKDFEFGHAISTADFSSGIKSIVNGEHNLKPEQLIAQIINEDTKAHIDVGFGYELIGHLERLLRSEDIDHPGVQRAERILGVLELERRILDSSAKSEEKKQAIEHIHHSLLGEKGFTCPPLSAYKAQLDNALGTEKREYKSAIALPSPDKFARLLKERYKLDDISIANGNISRTVIGYMRRETSLLIEGFEGNLPEGMFSSDESSMLNVVSNLRDTITTALHADTMEAEAVAKNEMLETFGAMGFPVDQLLSDGTLDDANWKDNFIFSDSLFHSPESASSDIIQVLIQIWQSILKGLELKK